MTRWTWHAQDHSGRTCSGEISASSNQAALQQVRNLGVYAAQVYAINSRPQATANNRHKVSSKQVLWLTQQLAFLCAAGLPLLNALLLLRGQTLPAALTGVIDQLHHDLQQGLTLPKEGLQNPRASGS
jgi:type II secretory pathway component PulF